MKMIKKLQWVIFLSLCMIWTGITQAQDNAYTCPKKEESKYMPTTGIRVALLGTIIYPGFIVGVERPYLYTQKTKAKTNNTKVIYKERYLSHSLGMYHHPDFHTNYFLQTEWVARRQKNKGFYYESSFGIGFSRTFVDAVTFTVLENGEVINEPFSGNWYGLASIGGSIGYNANLKKGKPYSLYLKNQLLVFFPHNSLFNLRPTLELGVNYNFSGFWQSNPKYRQKATQNTQMKKTRN